MKSNVNDIGFTYTMSRLTETAKTFRNLGDVYGQTNGIDNGFKRQLILVADILEDLINMNLCAKLPEKSAIRALERKCFARGILAKNIRVVTGKRKEIIVTARTMVRGCVAEHNLKQAICDVFGMNFFSFEENRVVINDEPTQFVYYQEDRFRILTGISRRSKGKQDTNGDNFLMSRLNCGKMVAAIADGCGTGRQAFVESRMVIELMENCIDAGFEEKTAIDLINSAYVSGSGFTNPVTMDMAVIDCQSGFINCIKLGAVSTFIKRGNWVEIIKSTTLPMGVLEQVDYDSTSKKLYNGDYIVMLSDGVLDNLPGVDKEGKMVEIINSIDDKKPSIIADKILKESLKNNNNKASDDCTVMVLGVFDTYDNR